MKRRIRQSLVYGAWQAHVVTFAFAFIGWLVAIYISPHGFPALLGLAVGGTVGLLVVKHMMDWK